ncbi:MAG: rRNA pseudouridine synthase [Clostridia bacterium]|nr:rRNA pseudouridine synthase [Clostridia bacterium]
MRLDKYLSDAGTLSRRDTAKAVRAGRITVNGEPAGRPDMKIEAEKDEVALDGEIISPSYGCWILLNKPAGYVSVTEGRDGPCVMELLPDRLRRIGLFVCGRLDKNTTGLLLLTNDGTLSHRLLSPARHVDKEYAFRVKFPLSEEDLRQLESGVDIGGYVTKPCTVSLDGPSSGKIILREGKYHQIKLMMEAVHNQITNLERIRFGPLTLPEDLPQGHFKELSQEQIDQLKTAAGMAE